MNRLGDATSPYLLQHADNPVHWWPWCPEAFEEARRRDVPVLISVGYAACHWCHVMAHESFADAATADVVNEAVVAIKVDREERPDVDAVYMTATQAMTGHGGWPMTVFATPDGEPFLCGTYYPREAFVHLVRAVSQAWQDRRSEVLRQGATVVEAVGRAQGRQWTVPPSPITSDLLDAAAASLHQDHDDVYGGFGGAPKFPPHLAMLFLLRHYQRTGSSRSLEVVRHTGEAMARGGIYDQLAGGFARYSVDDHWIVPHFEKMLYDNALLLRVYTHLWRLTGDTMAGRVAGETVEFLLSMRSTEGGLISAVDADTDGVEGSTYVWNPEQLRAALGDEDGDRAADLFGVTAAGTFEHGLSVLRLARDVDGADEPVRARWRTIRARLAQARARRRQPTRDDKVVSAWAGLAVTALIEFARTADALGTQPWLPDPTSPDPTSPDPTSPDPTSPDPTSEPMELVEAARLAATQAGGLLIERHLVGGRLRRASRYGVVGEPAGVLEDYGCVAEAFCALHQLTGEGRWLSAAGELVDAALEHFGDGTGGFYDTADDAERLVARPADPTDNATPSGLSAIAAALLAYSALTGEPRYRDAAQQALESVTPLLGRHARFAGYAAAAAEALLSGPYEIAIAGTDDSPGGGELARTAWRLAPPGAVVVTGPPDSPGVPLLGGRPMLDGAPTAYLCRGFVCDRPVTTVADLTAMLSPI